MRAEAINRRSRSVWRPGNRHNRMPARSGSARARARLVSVSGLHHSFVQPEVLEAFGDRKALALSHLGGPLAYGLLQFFPVAHLALVFLERLDLKADRLADVDPDIG